MHRFWVFPLVLGGVGALYPPLTVAQVFTIRLLWARRTSWFAVWDFKSAVSGGIDSSLWWTATIGVAIGMVAALLEMRRNGMSDRSGVRAVRRLLGNGWWLGIYALLVEASLTLAMIAGLMVGISRYLLLGLLFLSFLIVNLAAILWATIRTASTDDVLSPRVSRGKWRASTRAIE